MRYVLMLPALLLLSGCVTAQRYNTGAVQSQLEARAHEYQQAQEQRVYVVTQRLMRQIPDPPNVELIIPDDATVYAGTTYGKLVVTYGMVRFAATDDELAMVIGHELAHHTQGHVRNRVLANVGIAILANVANYYARGTGRSVQRLGGAFYDHYNQNQELEADRVGMGYAAAAGYDPRAAATLWERASIELPGTLTAAFFDSHPSSPERMLAAQHNADILLAQGYAPAPPGARIETVAQRTESTTMQPAAAIAALTPPSSPWATWPPMFNVVSQSDVKLRAAETEYRAGKMSLQTFRQVKRELSGL